VPRSVAAVIVAVATVGLLGGCRSDESAVPPARAAAPQRVELGWEERTPAKGPGLVFRVHRFAVTAGGWEANIEIVNRTGLVWELGAGRRAAEQSFGVMLFATGELDEVERRGRKGELPGLRPVRKFVPAVPSRLVPGRHWRATISADGTLAAGRHLRIVFGPLIAVGDPPDGMPAQFVWITDHSYLLRP
jgi:hypothetical protein